MRCFNSKGSRSILGLSTRACLSALALSAASGLSNSVYATTHDVYRVGFVGGDYFDSERQSEDSSVNYVNRHGLAAGTSSRYDFAPFSSSIAWVDDGTGATSVGFYGPGYVDSRSRSYTYIRGLNDMGYATGTSNTYDPAGTRTGQVAWIDNGSGAVSLGLTGPAQTRADGYQLSFVTGINNGGFVQGYATRYTPGVTDAGDDVWVGNTSGSWQVGFSGAGYERSDGFAQSYIYRLSDSGVAFGSTNRYSGADQIGDAVWKDDGTGPVRLGYWGGDFARANGFEDSHIFNINNAGVAIGYSEEFYGPTETSGRTVWKDDGSGPVRLGLCGAGFQRASDGYEYAYSTMLTDSGVAFGFSHPYAADLHLGRAAWVDDGSGASRLGLHGPGYARSDGFEYATIYDFNQAGTAVGVVRRYNGADQIGIAAWKDDGSGAVQIGLTGPGHTRQSDGSQATNPNYLNEAGDIAGSSHRYSGSDYNGQSVWIDTGSGAVEIGLTTGIYMSSAGRVHNNIREMNESGQLAGEASRYDGTDSLGSAGWFYDKATGTTSELLFSTRDDGYASTRVYNLSEDGMVFGNYEKFDGATSLGTHLFAWSPLDGFIDFGSDFSALAGIEVYGSFQGVNEEGGTAIFYGDVGGDSSRDAAFVFRPMMQPAVLGDLNGDGSVTNGDINAFVLALTDPAGYAAQHPGLDMDTLGDFSGDGLLTNGDIAGFIAALTGGGPGADAVPEPGSLFVLSLSGLALMRRRSAGN